MRIFVVGQDLSIRYADTLENFLALEIGEEFDAETKIGKKRAKVRVKKGSWGSNVPYAGFLAKAEAENFRKHFEEKPEY